ncbi:MAG: Glu/Leu/Phe/Val dehydrogenase [Deltaproteobacteria bacterium]|nr:Glu/Leu/Phe/Val dehydrogenase [Deltaproteobacteria bacterium]
MAVFEELAKKDHEQVIFCHDQESGLKAIIAIHDTTLGPALGGCRMWHYENEELALRDVLRLSRGMTYKSAAAGLNLGGGKAVIIGNHKTDKSETLFRAYGRFVQGLCGRYITAEDVGTTVREMEWVRMETDYVTGISRALGGSGDPSPVTALGCYEGIKASVKWQTGSESLEGKRVAVQGVGAVGYHLVQHLARDGAKVVATDIDGENLRRITTDFRSVEAVAPDKIYGVECDVFAPCALGAVLNDDTIPQLRCAIVAGSANNVLADEEKHSAMLERKSILYAPDYVINAGGLINVANELEGYNRERAVQQAASIYNIVTTIYQIARDEKITTTRAANALAERRIQRIGRIKGTYSGTQVQKRGRGII